MQAEQLTTLSGYTHTHTHTHSPGEIGNPHRDTAATITNNLTQVKRAHKLLQIDKGVKGSKERPKIGEKKAEKAPEKAGEIREEITRRAQGNSLAIALLSMQSSVAIPTFL